MSVSSASTAEDCWVERCLNMIIPLAYEKSKLGGHVDVRKVQ